MLTHELHEPHHHHPGRRAHFFFAIADYCLLPRTTISCPLQAPPPPKLQHAAAFTGLSGDYRACDGGRVVRFLFLFLLVLLLFLLLLLMLLLSLAGKALLRAVNAVQATYQRPF